MIMVYMDINLEINVDISVVDEHLDIGHVLSCAGLKNLTFLKLVKPIHPQGNFAFLCESAMLDYFVQQDCNLTQIGGLLDSKVSS